jgi:hypothetical protein
MGNSLYLFADNSCAYTCGDGSEDRSGCQLCAAGKYKKVNVVAACADCFAGEYQTGTGMSFCTRCAAGTFLTGTGSTQCAKCTRGTFAAQAAATACAGCAGGTYASSLGTIACLPCAQGFQSGRGAAFCYPAGSKTAFYDVGVGPACQLVSDAQFAACN